MRRAAAEDGRAPGQRGFTLVEFIGVMAVVAILAAIVLPSVIRQMDHAARVREAADLDVLADGLERSILRNKRIPAYANLPNVIAAELAMSHSSISKNPRGYTRAFLVDGDLRINGAVLPYTQNVLLTNPAPVSARLLILSSLSRALPVPSGVAQAAVFNEIWNTPDDAKPASWTNWLGSGEDLKIKRINLEPLFHRLVVVNRDGAATPPRVSIETTNTIQIVHTNTGMDAYYLSGSMVGLCDSGGTPIRKFALTEDTSCVFEGVWRDHLGGGDASNEEIAQLFAQLAQRFLAAEWYPGANQGGRTGTQQGALTAMFNFMLIFSLWADPFPHFNKHGEQENNVPEYMLLIDLVSPANVPPGGGRLAEFTGAGGLLN